MSSSVKAFERSVSRVYNKAKRDGKNIEHTLYEFIGLCKEFWYRTYTESNILDGAGKPMGEHYSRVFHTAKNIARTVSSVNELLAKINVSTSSRIGTVVATCLTNTV